MGEAAVSVCRNKRLGEPVVANVVPAIDRIDPPRPVRVCAGGASVATNGPTSAHQQRKDAKHELPKSYREGTLSTEYGGSAQQYSPVNSLNN
ncbi:hypothetical protein [uncultured Mycobacterium sp.]|uniref:hypothetical protein n=1 Tax=uncultured Mycobacterium sp. TaxID=171292 RepID=UPI0035CBADDD